MKASELKELSLQELNARLKDLKDEQFNLSFQHATGQLENPMRLPQTRKDIARVLTVIRQKELAQA
ncbi:MAG: 50S ribosomal protein L29 [Desulfarculus sp.]|jgi:large subunit ribosomal protein L29|nr:50S ribosomal protein L29 [Desulfarculus sp.]